MFKSKFFLAAALCLSIIPFLVMDIPMHYVNWVREVHDEMIDVVQVTYNYTPHQKGLILDQILKSNKTLMAMMYLKSFISLILLCLAIYFFNRHKKEQMTPGWKMVLTSFVLIICVAGLKLYTWTSFSGNKNINLLSTSSADTTLNNLYNTNFKGKVVYVDFWGTTCPPCLEEFRNFTKPLKAKYHDRKDIAYLYICGGHQLIWKQQMEKFDIEGSHIFLDSKAYQQMYKQAIKGDTDQMVYMPRYLIIDKNGKIVNTNAPRPSDTDSITKQLDKYLAVK